MSCQRRNCAQARKGSQHKSYTWPLQIVTDKPLKLAPVQDVGSDRLTARVLIKGSLNSLNRQIRTHVELQSVDLLPVKAASALHV